MGKKHLRILNAILFICIIIFTVSQIKITANMKLINKEKLQLIVYNNHENNIRKDLEMSRLRSEGVRIDSHIAVIDENNQSVNLVDTASISSTIVFRFSESSCFSCVNSYFDFLINNIGDNLNIVVIGGNNQIETIKDMIEFRSLNISCFTAKSGAIGLELDRKELPYFFTIKEEHEAKYSSNIFIPSKDNDPFREYIRSINITTPH